jgi:hypothetical protein
MRKTVIAMIAAVLLLACGLSAWAADYAELASSSSGQTVQPMKALNLVLNPLGFLQFGPIVQLEFRFSPGLYGLAHVRMHGLGLLSHLILGSEPAYYAFAVGAGARYFFVSREVPHAPYVGFIAEFGYNPYFGDVGYSSEYEGTSLYLTFAANGGYRWRFGRFIVQVGAYAGLSPTLYSQWHYLTSPSVANEGDLDVVFFGMLEVSIGWGL